MKTVAYVAATLACLVTAPAFAASPAAAVDQPTTLAQLDVRIGERDRDRDWDRRRYREREGRREGCRDVTVRERRDGETVVRHIRRCD